jgi:hypothetical protein
MFLFGVNLLKKKQVFIELLKIYGIGLSRSCFVCDQLGFGKNIKVKGLSRQQIFSLKDFLLTIYSLDVERKLKANMLLPKIDLGYSYLSEPSAFDQYKFQDYKVGLNFYFPLFLRKERGSLKITKFEMQDAQFNLDLEKVQLTNKIIAQQTEIASLEKQKKLIDDLVKDNQTMLNSEERLFTFGESSLFLINTRENNLVNVQISQLTIENRYFNSNAELFKIMANPE